MLTVVRDEQGRILAACEWFMRDTAGRIDSNGTLVWLEQVELSQGADLRQVAAYLIAEIGMLKPEATGAYWVRRDKDNGRRPHGFTRSQLMRHILEEVR